MGMNLRMICLKSLSLCSRFKNIFIMRSVSTSRFVVQVLNKRAILKLSGPDTKSYLQSMITNDIRNVENSPAIFSLLLNSRGRVLYDILLYKLNCNEYFVEYESSAVEYLHKHLLMYRLRKDVKIEPLNTFLAWVIYPESERKDSLYVSCLKTISDFLQKQDGVAISVIDPRTNLLGVRAVTSVNSNLISILTNGSLYNLTFQEGNSYRLYRYKLGIGEGVIDHPPGVCLPLDTNVDFLNGVSFTKGCYIGQELTARLHFTLNVKKRLMPVVIESSDSFPEFPPECSIVNERKEKIGRLRSNLGPHGLGYLKFEESLKTKHLIIDDFNIKLKVIRPTWWPDNIDDKNKII